MATGITLRWVGQEDLDRVAEVQTRVYGTAEKEREANLTGLRRQQATGCADYVLAERDGWPVACATCWAYTMWVRGSAVACQGVAGVGTIRTERRGRGGQQGGVASELMREVVRHARERQQVVSALMPFRVSFYERFGYGVVERRYRWVVPLTILPSGPLEGFGYYRPELDLPAIEHLRQQMVQRGQCDIERPAIHWEGLAQQFNDGFVVVDHEQATGALRSWMYLRQHEQDGKRVLDVQDMGWDRTESFVRQLHFLAGQRDQFSTAELVLPADLPLNWLLKERQVSARPLNHPAGHVRQGNRMQVRILDHRRFLEALHLPKDVRGQAVVAVHENEGNVSRFRMEVGEGRAAVSPSDASPDVECCDRVWAALACGELGVAPARELGLISGVHTGALPALQALGAGPVPFCRESF